MTFIGVDAAWGEVNETGIVALDPSGRIRDAGWTTGLAATVEWICDRAEPDTLVFIDAPLVVTNPAGQRLCETHVGQRYWRWSVSVSERYPYTTIVGYEPFGYDVRPLYKRKPKAMRTAEFRAVRAAACDVLIERVAALAHSDPPLDLRSHEVTRKLLEEPSPLDNLAYKHREDLLDAVLCAWTSSLWHRHGFERCQVLGAVPDVGRPAATIIAPARPEQRVA